MVIHLTFNQTVGPIATKAGIRLSAHRATLVCLELVSQRGSGAG